MKFLLTFVLSFFIFTAFAQKRQNVYFLRTDGSSAGTKDSADFIRVVTEPDSGSIYFKVAEFYKNNKPKLIAESSTVEPLTFENSMINYFPDGKKQNISHYKGGKNTGSSYTYYSNGKLKSVEIYPDSLASRPYNQTMLLMNYNDTTGKVLVTDGNGYYVSFDKKDRREGNVLNGRRDGVWKGMFYDAAPFTETYNNGQLISGVFTGPDNKKYTYDSSEQVPEFPGGLTALGKFLASTIHYPAMARENNVQGRVWVTFVVHSDGTLMDIHVKSGVDPDLDREAIRVVKKFPRWKPGIQNGRPVRIQYTIPIAFNLDTRNY